MKEIKLLISDNIRILSLTAIAELFTSESMAYNACTDLIQPEVTESIYVNADSSIEIKGATDEI